MADKRSHTKNTDPSEAAKTANNEKGKDKSSAKGKRRSPSVSKAAKDNVAHSPKSSTEKSLALNKRGPWLFFVLKSALFGVTAALVGVSTALLIWHYQEVLPFNDSRSNQLSALKDEVQTLVESEGQRSLLSDDMGKLRRQIGELIAQDDSLKVEAQDIRDQLGLMEMTLADFQARDASSALNNDQLESIIRRIDALEQANMNNNSGIRVGTDGSPMQGFSTGGDSQTESKTRQQPPMATRSELLSLEKRLAEFEKLDGERLSAFEAKVEELISSTELPQMRVLGWVGVRSAAEIGAPYSALIKEINGPMEDVPEIVFRFADSGIVTLEDLRLKFVGASRQTLKILTTGSRSEGWVASLSGLFRVRHLSPREGQDAAAILSRSEEALRRKDLKGALRELTMLPESGQEAMADWVNQAETRLAVLAALDAMLMAAEEDES